MKKGWVRKVQLYRETVLQQGKKAAVFIGGEEESGGAKSSECTPLGQNNLKGDPKGSMENI